MLYVLVQTVSHEHMQVYGFGKSEELIGDLRKKYSSYKPFIATKVAPLPWRFVDLNMRNALKVRSWICPSRVEK